MPCKRVNRVCLVEHRAREGHRRRAGRLPLAWRSSALQRSDESGRLPGQYSVRAEAAGQGFREPGQTGAPPVHSPWGSPSHLPQDSLPAGAGESCPRQPRGSPKLAKEAQTLHTGETKHWQKAPWKARLASSDLTTPGRTNSSCNWQDHCL